MPRTENHANLRSLRPLTARLANGITATTTLIMCQYGYALATSTTGCGSSSAASSTNLTSLTGLLQSIANLMSGTWFKMITIIGMAIVIGLLIFDGANLGQGIKNLLSVIAIVLVFFFIISMVMNAGSTMGVCSGT